MMGGQNIHHNILTLARVVFYIKALKQHNARQQVGTGNEDGNRKRKNPS